MGAAVARRARVDGQRVMVSKYSDDERARIFEAAREALEAAEATLNAPRPEIEPPCETRAQKWKREADEQQRRFAEERAASEPLTEWQAANLEHRLAGLVEHEKRLVLDVMAHSLAAVRDELIEHLEAKIASLEQKVAALAISETKTDKAEVIDLPAWPARKTA
jgi:hypothetical protein